MSYAMLVLGDLEIPRDAWKRWLGLVVDPAKRDDWVGGLRVHSASPRRSVAHLLAWLPENISPWLTAAVDEARSGIAVQGVMAEDDFIDYGVELAELFRVAAEVGGRGELVFLEEQVIPSGEREPEETYLVRVAPAASSVGHTRPAEQRRILLSDAFDELYRAVLAMLDEETREVFEVEKQKRWKKLAGKPKATAKPAKKARAPTKKKG